MDAERYVMCGQGHEHWGAAGAAGLLICALVEGAPLYLLQHRAEETHHGDCWGVPGGALEFGEDALAGAARETAEETTLPPGWAPARDEVQVFVSDHGGWAYTTFLAFTDEAFVAEALTWETGPLGLAWFTHGEIAGLPLHPGFAAFWSQVSTDFPGA